MALNLENKKQVATILLAVGLGLVAAVLTSQYVKKSIEQQTEIISNNFDQKNNKVLSDMQATQEELKQVAVQQKSLAQQQQDIRKMAADIQQGNVAAKPQGGASIAEAEALATRTPAGKRALTILIDSLSAVGGLIKPGDKVDIIASLDVPKTTSDKPEKKNVISVLFQNIQVLAVGTRFNESADALIYDAQQKSRSLNVTIALDPEEASLVAFAQVNGKLQFSLRPPTDGNTEPLRVASWDTLSEYVLNKQGTELLVPQQKATISEEETPANLQEIKPFIQIFKSGQEVN